MDARRGCCCGPSGACGMTGFAGSCGPDDIAQTVQLWIPFRGFRWSGRYFSTEINQNGPQTNWDYTESGTYGVGYQWDRYPTESEVAAEFGLPAGSGGSFSVVIPPVSGSGPLARIFFRRSWAFERTGIVGGGAATGTPGLIDSSASLMSPTYRPGCVDSTQSGPFGTQTTERDQAINGLSYVAFSRFSTTIPDSFLRSRDQTQSVSFSSAGQSSSRLPPYWEGPADTDICDLLSGPVNSPFTPRPPEAPPATDGNAGAIEAVQMNDPLRNCRGCGP